MDSILNSIKQLLNIDATITDFDVDLVLHINTVFAFLNELGVGPIDGFYIEDASTTWDDYDAGTANSKYMVKSFMFLKVRQMFDPPTNSIVQNASERAIAELEWRLHAEMNPITTFE